eukprot:CAMPEP_0204278476 /NCGR_PEP_ID=MMETSP0468-20130131/30628_1 /ASSEMBLY_ACC=CAM_ASM_000383 /TAXON_ID=2969 /ORGANISM="Oxyrrhis marina" /LENGTH=35 /DNA_ID= /DNA_START= /DNA_END= /DNA_ORIENTATION=
MGLGSASVQVACTGSAKGTGQARGNGRRSSGVHAG